RQPARPAYLAVAAQPNLNPCCATNRSTTTCHSDAEAAVAEAEEPRSFAPNCPESAAAGEGTPTQPSSLQRECPSHQAKFKDNSIINVNICCLLLIKKIISLYSVV